MGFMDKLKADFKASVEKEKERLTKEQDLRRERIMELESQNALYCPKCLSTQLSANKKGFSVGKALVGGALTGGIGLAAGALGKNKIEITCLKCGNKFKPGK